MGNDAHVGDMHRWPYDRSISSLAPPRRKKCVANSRRQQWGQHVILLAMHMRTSATNRIDESCSPLREEQIDDSNASQTTTQTKPNCVCPSRPSLPRSSGHQGSQNCEFHAQNAKPGHCTTMPTLVKVHDEEQERIRDRCQAYHETPEENTRGNAQGPSNTTKVQETIVQINIDYQKPCHGNRGEHADRYTNLFTCDSCLMGLLKTPHNRNGHQDHSWEQ